jgi:hypothetical protein
VPVQAAGGGRWCGFSLGGDPGRDPTAQAFDLCQRRPLRGYGRRSAAAAEAKVAGPSPALARPPGPLAGQLLQAIEPKIVDARLAAHVGNLVE